MVSRRETKVVSRRETKVVSRRETKVVSRRETKVVSRKETGCLPEGEKCCLPEGDKCFCRQKLQNRAARMVTNSSYDAAAANLIKELKWPTVHDMIKQETTGTIVFKSISGLAPTYLSTLFTRNSTREIVNLRNRETDLLAPRMKTSNGQKAFSFFGAKVWNELKHEVKLAPSLSTFK